MARLTKKGIVLIVIVVAVVLGGTGYLLWTVNQEQALAPFDIDAASDADKDSCGGCASTGYEWKWSRNGGCKKRYNPSACGKPGDDKTPDSQGCGGGSAAGCSRVGQVCRDTGRCVNTDGTSGNDVTCACQGGVPSDPGTPTPVPDVLVCDGGALSTPATSDTATIGEAFEISGYAFDEDGINKTAIAVSIDGTVVGNATATDACPTGNASICSSVGEDNNPVVWSYSFTPTQEKHEVSVSWADTTGASGGDCTKAVTLSSSPKEVSQTADWSLSPGASAVSCVEVGDSMVARVSYTVLVTNSGAGEGDLSKVTATLDSGISESFVQTESITPDATLSGNLLTWTLSGADATFAAGESKSYKFTIEVPEASYGQFTNVFGILPAEDGASTITESLTGTVSCEADGTPTAADPVADKTPSTGIFDSWLAKVGAGFLLISFGLAYIYFDGLNGKVASSLNKFMLGLGEEEKVKKSRKRFEKRVAK